MNSRREINQECSRYMFFLSFPFGISHSTSGYLGLLMILRLVSPNLDCNYGLHIIVTDILKRCIIMIQFISFSAEVLERSGKWNLNIRWLKIIRPKQIISTDQENEANVHKQKTLYGTVSNMRGPDQTKYLIGVNEKLLAAQDAFRLVLSPRNMVGCQKSKSVT